MKNHYWGDDHRNKEQNRKESRSFSLQPSSLSLELPLAEPNINYSGKVEVCFKEFRFHHYKVKNGVFKAEKQQMETRACNFQVLEIWFINSHASMHILVNSFGKYMVSFLLGLYLGTELPGHRLAIHSDLVDNC